MVSLYIFLYINSRYPQSLYFQTIVTEHVFHWYRRAVYEIKKTN